MPQHQASLPYLQTTKSALTPIKKQKKKKETYFIKFALGFPTLRKKLNKEEKLEKIDGLDTADNPSKQINRRRKNLRFICAQKKSFKF